MIASRLLWSVVWLAALAASQELSKPGVNDQCAGFCKDNYSPETNVDACEEGCRVFSMLQFVSGTDKVDETREKCKSGCVKSFNIDGVRDACKTGCEHQVPFTGGRMEISMNSDDPMFDVAKSAFDGVFDRVTDQMNDNYDRFGSVFGDRDQFQDMQRDMDAMSRRMENLMNRLMGRQSTSERLDSTSDEASSNRQPAKPVQRIGGHENVAFEGPEVDNVNEKNEPILRVQMTPLNQDNFPWLDNQPRPIVFVDRIPTDDDTNWLACLTARARHLSAMTRWLVCLALFMCIACMIWICLAIIRTAPRRRLLIRKSDEVMKIATIDSSAVEKQLLAQQDVKMPFIPAVHNIPHNSPPPAYDEATAAAAAVAVDDKRPLA